MEGSFLVRQIYEDELTYNLIAAAVDVLSKFLILLINFWDGMFSEIPANAILELFGKTFFEFCQDSGFDKILQVLGATPRDFLQVGYNRIVDSCNFEFSESGCASRSFRNFVSWNESSLISVYSPSWRWSFNSSLLLRQARIGTYRYRNRQGNLSQPKSGSEIFFQTVASKLHGTEVVVEILKTKEDCDHVQFLITEASGPGRVQNPEIDEIQTLSLGMTSCFRNWTDNWCKIIIY